VVPVDIAWSDIGSWWAVWERLAWDRRANAAIGDVIAEDCQGSLFHANGPAIAAVGLKDLGVVTPDDMVLVLPRGRAQDVRAITQRLKAAKRREHIDPPGGEGE